MEMMKENYKKIGLEAVPKTLYLSAASLLCFYSSIWMVQDIFPDWQLTSSAWTWINSLILITIALYEMVIRALPRFQLSCRLIVPVVYGLVLYRFAREHQIDLEDGACAFVAQFLEKFNKHLKTSYSFWKGKTELISMSFAFWCICIVLVMLILVLITGWRIFFLIMPAAVLSAELLIGYVPQWKGLAFFLAAVMIVFAAGDDSRKRTLRVHLDGRQRKIHSWYLRWLPVVCLASVGTLLLILGGAVFEMPAVRLMDKAPVVQEFQRNTERNLEAAVRGYFTQQRENVGNKSPKYTGKEVMKVTASVRPVTDVYLRGFYGTDYKDGVWVCDREAFEEACMQAGIQQNDAAKQLLQTQYDTFSKGTNSPEYWFASGESGDVSESEEIVYTIEHTGLHNKYAYLPYAVDYAKGQSTERLIGDVTVQKGWGQKKFTFHGWNRPIDHSAISRRINMRDKEIFQWYDAFVQRTYFNLSSRVCGIEEYLNALDPVYTQNYIYDENGDIQVDALAGISVNRLLPIIRNFQKLMKVYNNNYMATNQNRLSMAFFIGSLLKRYQTYSLNLDTLPAGADAVDYFLTQSHKGYCVHFASAAVLMLREIGIPARYVSGFVARTDDFKYLNGSYEASVKDSSAHAWVEIYLDQIGWVPVDVTPGQGGQRAAGSQNMLETEDQTASEDNVPETDDTREDDTFAEEEDTKAEDTADTQDNADKDKETEGVHKTYWQSVFPKVVCIIIVVIFIVLICLLIRYVIRCYQEVLKKELEDGKYRKAVLRINQRLYRKLLRCGKIRYQNVTDADYEQILKTVFSDIEAKGWVRYMQIVKEAAFSGKELRSEDAYFCYQIYSRLCRA